MEQHKNTTIVGKFNQLNIQSEKKYEIHIIVWPL